jgi:hypothetical protein
LQDSKSPAELARSRKFVGVANYIDDQCGKSETVERVRRRADKIASPTPSRAGPEHTIDPCFDLTSISNVQQQHGKENQTSTADRLSPDIWTSGAQTHPWNPGPTKLHHIAPTVTYTVEVSTGTVRGASKTAGSEVLLIIYGEDGCTKELQLDHGLYSFKRVRISRLYECY